MIRQGNPPLSPQIVSPKRIWMLSLATGGAAFAIAILIQWMIYDNWMHWQGLLRIVGSALAGVIAGTVAAHRQSVLRKKKIQLLRRIESIPQITDRLRNAL